VEDKTAVVVLVGPAAVDGQQPPYNIPPPMQAAMNGLNSLVEGGRAKAKAPVAILVLAMLRRRLAGGSTKFICQPPQETHKINKYVCTFPGQKKRPKSGLGAKYSNSQVSIIYISPSFILNKYAN